MQFLGVAVLFRDIDRATLARRQPGRRQRADHGSCSTIGADHGRRWRRAAAKRRHDLDQPGRLAGRHVPPRPAFPAAGPLARRRGARPHRRAAAASAGASTEIAIDRDLLATGRFALSAAAGVFEDGTPFVTARRDRSSGAARTARERAQRARLSRRADPRSPGAVEIAAGRRAEGPLRAAASSRRTTRTPPRRSRPSCRSAGCGCATCWRPRTRRLSLHRPRPRDRGRGGPARDARRPLDPARRWSARPSPPLAGLIAELAGMLNQRGEALAARMTAPGSRGVAEVPDFLLLQSVNRWQKLLSHWADAGAVHPEDLYRALVQMAGEFATFTEATRRPNTYPAYRHDDLQRSFAPVVADLRRSLSAVIEQTAVPIPLQERRHGVRVGPIADREHPARVQLRAVRAGRRADRDAAAAVPDAGQDRRGRADPRAGQRGAAGHRGAAVAGRAAADAVLRRGVAISNWTATVRTGSRCRPPAGSRSTCRAISRTCNWSSGRSAAERARE